MEQYKDKPLKFKIDMEANEGAFDVERVLVNAFDLEYVTGVIESDGFTGVCVYSATAYDPNTNEELFTID